MEAPLADKRKGAELLDRSSISLMRLVTNRLPQLHGAFINVSERLRITPGVFW